MYVPSGREVVRRWTPLSTCCAMTSAFGTGTPPDPLTVPRTVAVTFWEKTFTVESARNAAAVVKRCNQRREGPMGTILECGAGVVSGRVAPRRSGADERAEKAPMSPIVKPFTQARKSGLVVASLARDM